MRDITNEHKTERFNSLHNKIVDTFTNYNDLSYSIFRVVSKFSELLPDSLRTLIRLSDMITDAIVVSGRSSLSSSVFNTKIISNSLAINPDSGSLTLSYKTAKDYAINSKKSYIQTENNYRICNENKNSLSSFSDLINGSPILIESDDQYFKYTFALSLESRGVVSCIDLELSLNTSSYPLISEIYYINEDNKKVYCTIMNSSEKQYNLDLDRQKNNVYTILLPNVKTNKLFITFEDKDKTDFIINKIGVRKLTYEAEGEVILGPIVSTYPILKASVESLGDVDYANFYVSPDNTTWYELAAASELSFSQDLDKVISFNTVGINSLKSNKDYKELYLKVKLRRILDKDSANFYKTTREELGTSTTLIQNQPVETTVYEIKEPIHYGSTTYKESVTSSNLFIPTLAYTESKGEYFVRGFVEANNAITPKTDKTSINITTKPLKIGGDNIEAISFDPISSNIYGYATTTRTGKINTKASEDIVILLSDEYSRDIYKVVQNNKQILIDLSLGYISSCLEATVIVDSEGTVELYDSTSKLIRTLEVKNYNDNFYVNLIDEGLFTIPETNSELSLNSLYPIKLNAENEYGLKDNKIESKEVLIHFENLAILYKELIDFNIKLSKENGNKLNILDNVLKEKYTEYSEEVIPAYTGATVIKLKNKHIKKGSLRLSIKND